jgi:hypothetical protein
MGRIQVLVSEQERETLRRVAEREGLSLSGWLRRIGLEKAKSASAGDQIKTVAQLDRFFRACDRREQTAREPDWNEHLAVIERSRGEGQTGT